MVKVHGPDGKAAKLLAALGNELDFRDPEQSFSPFYSDIGLGFDEQPGLAKLYLHYNRRTTALGEPFLALPGAVLSRQQTGLAIYQSLTNGSAGFLFCGRNTWLLETRGLGTLGFRLAGGPLTELRREITAQGCVLYDAYLPTQDKRDPDERFPFVLGVRVIRGTCKHGDDPAGVLVFSPDAEGNLLVAFSANMLEVDHERIERNLLAAPDSAQKAYELSCEWLETALGEIRFEASDPAESAVLAKAAYSLLSNCAEAPGMLAGRVSAFPSRGTYPVHYLWDTCFQNLAMEYMEPRLAVDSLLLLTENLRADGKMYHFLNSTWGRPHSSQPPLVGWAGLRLVRQRNDLALARRLLPALMRNNDWWLTQRMTRFGVITCPEPLETGWDDTPRLDHGPILALDMNSHLLLQIRCCAAMARMVGDKAAEAKAQAQADRLAGRMVEILYDPADNLFKDVRIETGEKLAIKTPACFLPLLAGVPISDEKARGMIEDSLLNRKHFFGPVPFPSVSYDDPTYDPNGYWRGPTWMPIAYLMLEILRKYGYEQQACEAARRLYAIMIRDGDLRELFNSQTGAGMRAYQQGWTAAVCLRLKMELDPAE